MCYYFRLNGLSEVPMKLSTLAVIGFMLIPNAFGATLIKPFQIKLHNYTSKNEKLEMRVNVSCRSYHGNLFEDMVNQRRMGEYRNCGDAKFDLKIEKDGLVKVPKLSLLNSIKKKNHYVGVEVVRVNEDGTKSELSWTTTQIDLEDESPIKDMSLYMSPSINLKPNAVTYYDIKIRDSRGNIFSEKSETRAGKNNARIDSRYLLAAGDFGVNPDLEVFLSVYKSLGSDSVTFYRNIPNFNVASELEKFIRDNDL